MYALILAGGMGSRLGLGEKALVIVREVPMIRRVADAFVQAGCDVVAVLSPRTPYTRNWCRANGIFHYVAEGRGYLEDIIEAVTALEISSPVFTCGTDLPLLSSDIVKDLMDRYTACGMDALSTWVPMALAEEHGYQPPCIGMVSGIEACPAGINILRGDMIAFPQEEERVLVADARLACHVNTKNALEIAERLISQSRRPS